CVSPTERPLARAGHIAARGLAFLSVDGGLPGGFAASHPSPFDRCRRESPEIVQYPQISIRVVSIPAKEPEIAMRVSPGAAVLARAGQVIGRRLANRPIDAGLSRFVAAANPGPFTFLRNG